MSYFLKIKTLTIILLICGFNQIYSETPVCMYQVQIEGVDDQKLLALLQSHSQLIEQQNTPPATVAALKRCIESEVAHLLKLLQSQAYYQAHILAAIDTDQQPWKITLNVDVGPLYPFSCMKCVPEEYEDFPFAEIFPRRWGLSRASRRCLQ